MLLLSSYRLHLKPKKRMEILLKEWHSSSMEYETAGRNYLSLPLTVLNKNYTNASKLSWINVFVVCRTSTEMLCLSSWRFQLKLRQLIQILSRYGFRHPRKMQLSDIFLEAKWNNGCKFFCWNIMHRLWSMQPRKCFVSPLTSLH